MYNSECRSPHGQSPPNDLVNTPEHLRQGYQGQPRQYDPKDFGLTGNEEWRDARFFRNMTYDTDAEGMETLHRLQPMRTGYCPSLAAQNLSSLPEECLADVSPPAFDTSMPSQMSGTGGEQVANSSLPNMCDAETPMAGAEATNYVNSLYREIVHRFESLRERIARGDNILPSEANQATASESSQLYNAQQQNNSVQRTLHKVTTHHDPCGNVTSRVEETSTVTKAPCPQLPNINCTPTGAAVGGQGRQLNYSMPTEGNIADISMPSFHETTITTPQGLPSECLAEISAPNLADISSRCGPSFGTDIYLDDISAPVYVNGMSPAMEDLCGISAPTLASGNNDNLDCTPVQSCDSRQEATPCTSELLDESMPFMDIVSELQNSQDDNTQCCCLDDITPATFPPDLSSPSGTQQRRQVSMPSQNIQDISAPTLDGSPHGGPVTYELSKNISIAPNVSSVRERQQRSMPADNICDTSAPAYYTSAGRGELNSECLENVTMPSFGGISGSTRRQQNLPSECLEDVSAPTFGRSMSRATPAKLQRQNRMMTSKNIEDISAPSFANSTNRAMTNDEYVENITPPTVGDISRRSAFMTSSIRHSTMRSRSPQRQQRSMPAQNMAAPLTSTRLVPQGLPSECLADMTAPSFGSYSRGMRETSEFLENVTMPSYGEVTVLRSPPQQNNGDRRAQQGAVYECLEDISAPSLARSMSRGHSRRKQDMSMPSQNISNISAPSYNYTGVANSRNRQEITMPSACLNDISAPSFLQSTMRTGTPRRQQQRSMPTQNICDISAPTFGSSGRGPFMDEQLLEDVTMPSFGQVSGSMRARTPRQQRSMPMQNIFDTSAPTLDSHGHGTMTGTSMKNATMHSSRRLASHKYCKRDNLPSFEGFSEGLRRNQQFMPAQNIYDISAPTFGSSGHSPMCEECLENVTMPSFGGVSGTSRRLPSMPSERLNDIRRQENALTANSFGVMMSSPMTSECLDNITMPSFGGVSEARQDPCTQRDYSSNVNSAAGRGAAVQTKSQRQHHRRMQSSNICDTSAPSFAFSSRGNGRIEMLEDMSMPSFGGVSGSMRARTPTRQNQSVALRNIYDNSAASIAYNGRGKPTSTRLEDISMPSFASSGRGAASNGFSFEQNSDASRARRQQQMLAAQTSGPNRRANYECLDSITMPSFYDVSESTNRNAKSRHMSREHSQSRLQRSNAFQNSFQFTNVSQTNECLENISKPSFNSTSRAAPGRVLTMPSEALDDETAPSFALSVSHGPAQSPQQLWDISPPAFEAISSLGSYPCRPQAISAYPEEYLTEVTQPSYGMSSRSMHQTPDHMSTKYMDHFSMPYKQNGSQLLRARSFPCVSCEQQIGDISDPCMDSPLPNNSYTFNDSKSAQRRVSCQNDLPRSRYETHSNRCQQSKSEASKRRSRSLPWTDARKCSPRCYTNNRDNRCLPSENLENITEPSMFDKSPRGMIAVNDTRYQTQEQLEDVSMPTMASVGQEQRNIFGTSGGSPRIEDICKHCGCDTQFGATQNKKKPKKPTAFQSVKKTKNIVDESMPSGLGLDSNISTSKKTKSESAKSKKIVVQRPSVGFESTTDKSKPNNCLQDSSVVIEETHEITVKASLTSVAHPRENNQLDKCDCIEDISQPQFESTAYDATGQFLNDISPPTLATSYQSTVNAADIYGPGESETFHDFDSMPNYAPFDELINSIQETTNSNPCQNSAPVRRNNIGSANPSANQRFQHQRRSNPNKKYKCSK